MGACFSFLATKPQTNARSLTVGGSSQYATLHSVGGSSRYATPEGTRARAARCQSTSVLGQTGLTVSALGFGCHRVENLEGHVSAMSEALARGVNVLDLAPNYWGGQAEVAAGKALRAVPREEVVVLTKVGNITHDALATAKLYGAPGAVAVQDNCWHSLDPVWIRTSLDQSLARLGLTTVDGVLLHNPEFQTKRGESMEAIYHKIGLAFEALEEEVRNGRIRFYGVSCAFYPLRDADPETLDLSRLMALLPSGHHFRVVQFPFNFAEPQSLLTPLAGFGKPLLQVCQDLGLATIANRPLDGFYLGCRGIARFTSQGTQNSELTPEDTRTLEAKLDWVQCTSFSQATLRTLLAVPGVHCHLAGMRLSQYVQDLVPVVEAPRLPSEKAVASVQELHRLLQMLLAVNSTGEADHGTAKDFRLNGECAWGAEFLNPVRVQSASQQREEDSFALYEYSRQGKLAEVNELLAAGIHPDDYAAYDGSRALTIALRSKRWQVSQALLKAGASTSLTTEDGSMAIIHAASSGCVECVKVVIEAKGDPNDVNEEGSSPLMLAAYYGQRDMVKALLALGANADHYASDHGTPLFVARERGDQVICEMIRQAGGTEKPPSDNPTEYASIRFGYGSLDTLK